MRYCWYLLLVSCTRIELLFDPWAFFWEFSGSQKTLCGIISVTSTQSYFWFGESLPGGTHPGFSGSNLWWNTEVLPSSHLTNLGLQREKEARPSEPPRAPPRWCLCSWVGQNPPCSQVLQSARKSSKNSGEFCGSRLMLTALEWTLRKSLRLCGGRARRTVRTNLFSTEVTSTLKNVPICLWHSMQSSSSLDRTRCIGVNFSCANDSLPLIDKWLMVQHLTWFSFWFYPTFSICVCASCSDLLNERNKSWYLHVAAKKGGGRSQRGQELLFAAELQGLFSYKMAPWYPASGRGCASWENGALSLGSEPAEKLIKGWDCRLEPEAVSTSRAPGSACIITALSAGKISTLLAPASTLPDSSSTFSTYQSPIFIIVSRLFSLLFFPPKNRPDFLQLRIWNLRWKHLKVLLSSEVPSLDEKPSFPNWWWC